MSDDTECPYCGAGVEINNDDGYWLKEERVETGEILYLG